MNLLMRSYVKSSNPNLINWALLQKENCPLIGIETKINLCCYSKYYITSSDSLLLSLELVNSILSGAAAYLPQYTGPSVDGW